MPPIRRIKGRGMFAEDDARQQQNETGQNTTDQDASAKAFDNNAREPRPEVDTEVEDHPSSSCKSRYFQERPDLRDVHNALCSVKQKAAGRAISRLVDKWRSRETGRPRSSPTWMSSLRQRPW